MFATANYFFHRLDIQLWSLYYQKLITYMNTPSKPETICERENKNKCVLSHYLLKTIRRFVKSMNTQNSRKKFYLEYS